jgi:hypothetical protein
VVVSEMNPAAVMDEIAGKLRSISGLRVFDYPPGSLTPPAAVITYPEGIDFDATYGRGMDRMVVPVFVMVGKGNDRGARDRLGAYCDGDGPDSVKWAVEAGQNVTFDSARVIKIDFDVVTMGGTEYLAALFSVDIVGRGNVS